MLHRLLASLSFVCSLFSVPGVACLVGGKGVDNGALYALFASSTILLMLIGILVAEAVARRRGHIGGSDRMEMALSIVFILQLTFSWRLFASVLNGNWSGLWIAAFCTMIALLVLQVGLAARFALKILSYKRGLVENKWTSRGWHSLATDFMKGATAFPAWPKGKAGTLLRMNPLSWVALALWCIVCFAWSCFHVPCVLFTGQKLLTWLRCHNHVVLVMLLTLWMTLAEVLMEVGVLLCMGAIGALTLWPPFALEFVRSFLLFVNAEARLLRMPTPTENLMSILSTTWLRKRWKGERLETFFGDKSIAPRRLEKQVAFLTRRFATHAPTWQLVIWVRQLALFIIGLLAEQTLSRIESGPREHFLRVRIVYATLAIGVTLAAWRYHRKWQPYYYRFQNSIESWLYSSTVMLIVLACIYSALPSHRRASEAVKATRVVIEIILLGVLVGSLIGAAAYAVYRLRAARRQLASIDLSEVLLSADTKIDGDLVVQLARGNIRLLRCSWLMSYELEAALGTDPLTGAKFMPRFQDLPPEAFFTPEEAEALFKRGDRSVLVLSYGWNRCAPPSDPTGITLAAVRRYLTSQGAAVMQLALFWEFVCAWLEPVFEHCVRPLVQPPC
jgi:hypothetical protein